MLEKAGAPPAIRAIAADNEAQLLERMGDLPKAIDLSEGAAALFPAHALQERATNALIRARLHHALGDDPAAAEAYGVAIGLAEQVARHSVDVGLYRRGFLAALRHLLPSSDEVTRRILAALIQDRKGEKAQSEANLIAAIERCLEQGDHLTALRTKAHLAAQKFDDGDVLTSGGLARDVQYEAASRGLALPEAMALGTLASLSDAGADSRLDTLFAHVTAPLRQGLLAVHRDAATAAKLDDKRLRWETYDSGTLDNQLAKLAERHGAYAIAAQHISAAAAYAEQTGDTWRLANRLAGLLALLKKLQSCRGRSTRSWFDCARFSLVARRTLGSGLWRAEPSRRIRGKPIRTRRCRISRRPLRRRKKFAGRSLTCRCARTATGSTTTFILAMRCCFAVTAIQKERLKHCSSGRAAPCWTRRRHAARGTAKGITDGRRTSRLCRLPLPRRTRSWISLSRQTGSPPMSSERAPG